MALLTSNDRSHCLHMSRNHLQPLIAFMLSQDIVLASQSKSATPLSLLHYKRFVTPLYPPSALCHASFLTLANAMSRYWFPLLVIYHATTFTLPTPSVLDFKEDFWLYIGRLRAHFVVVRRKLRSSHGK